MEIRKYGRKYGLAAIGVLASLLGIIPSSAIRFTREGLVFSGILLVALNVFLIRMRGDES